MLASDFNKAFKWVNLMKRAQQALLLFQASKATTIVTYPVLALFQDAHGFPRYSAQSPVHGSLGSHLVGLSAGDHERPEKPGEAGKHNGKEPLLRDNHGQFLLGDECVFCNRD